MKILIVSLAGIGDTLSATPLIEELRSQFPSAQIDCLVMWKGSADILKFNPHINRIYHFNMIKSGRKKSLLFCLKLRREKYDLSINTHPQSKRIYRIVSRIIGARIRASHTYECSGFIDRMLSNRSLPQDYHSHLIKNNLNLLSCAGISPQLRDPYYRLYLSKADRVAANTLFSALNPHGKAIVGIHVGSGGTKNLPLRRWPLENYLALIKKLLKNKRIHILLFGGPEEEKENEYLKSKIQNPNLRIVKTENMGETAGVISKCHVFLSVDTALMHVASAMKVPHQVVIETPTFNKTVHPPRNFTMVKNPALNGNHLDYYRYDGQPIRGTDRELEAIMKKVRVEDAYKVIHSILSLALKKHLKR